MRLANLFASMIGVAARESEMESVEEFFQLFKTPWEPTQGSRKHRVLLTTAEPDKDSLQAAELVLVCSNQSLSFDDEIGCPTGRPSGVSPEINWRGTALPIYCDLMTFEEIGAFRPLLSCAGAAAGYAAEAEGTKVVRLGYNPFQEAAFLLSSGQPPEKALTPTLDLHISILKTLILESGIPILEVLPVPHGYELVACLTHDIDFYGIRRHKFDRTLAGFFMRGVFGTFAGALAGRRTWWQVWENWKAVLSLPLVFAGVLPDPWRPFESYQKAEQGLPSTFFLIPFKNHAGCRPDGTLDRRRAVAYDVGDIRSEVAQLRSNGSEIGLHGLDAWRGPDDASREKDRLAAVTQQSNGVGVRMHWLYFDKDAPASLEKAGFGYDSTLGYNDAVGYRVGTAQVVQLPGTCNLLELPLHIQDTAMFFPGRMGLSERNAFRQCESVIESAVRHGGALTINWHGRSLAPERLWRSFYLRLLREIKKRRVWFATAGQTVDWFRQRRSIEFEVDENSSENTGYKIRITAPKRLWPPAAICHHRPVLSTPQQLFGATIRSTTLKYTGEAPLELGL